MGFFSTEFMTDRRTQWMYSIVKFQYQVSGVWRDAVINSKTLSGNSVKFAVHIPNELVTAHTITALRIIDMKGHVAGSQQVSVERTPTQGVLSTFEFPIQEV